MPAFPTHDAIVIGSGQAGPFLAVRLAQAGMRVARVEREHLGGSCVDDGCIPTKTLLASARAAHVAHRAAAFGLEVGGPVRVDPPLGRVGMIPTLLGQLAPLTDSVRTADDLR